MTQQSYIKKTLSFLRKPFSAEEFSNLTAQFKEQCEEKFGTACSVSIKFMTSAQFHQQKLDPDALAYEMKEKQEKIFNEVYTVKDIMQNDFNRAGHIEARVEPINKHNAINQSAFGQLELLTGKKVIELYAQGHDHPITLDV